MKGDCLVEYKGSKRDPGGIFIIQFCFVRVIWPGYSIKRPHERVFTKCSSGLSLAEPGKFYSWTGGELFMGCVHWCGFYPALQFFFKKAGPDKLKMPGILNITIE